MVAASLENLEAVFDRLDDLRGQPGLNGHVHHAGADPMDPTFAVNLPKLEEELRWTLEEARRKSFVNPPPPVE